jgi:hypothetical protein
MTHSVLRVSIAALGVAAFVSSFPLSAVRANTPPNVATPSRDEPPTVDFWVESGPDEAAVAQHPVARHHARHYAHHYARQGGRRYAYNPVAAAATGVVAGLGSLAAYPLYCFPNYGSCSIRWPYRF